MQIIFTIRLATLEINDYPETDHPPIEDMVNDLVDVKIEMFSYPEELHPELEDILEI